VTQTRSRGAPPAATPRIRQNDGDAAGHEGGGARVSVSGDWMQARRSRPAAPAVEYLPAGASRNRGSRIFTSEESSNEEPPSAVAHLRDVLNQLARQHDPGRERQLRAHPPRRKALARWCPFRKSPARGLRQAAGFFFLRFACAFRVQILGLSGEADARTVPSEAPRPHRGCRGSAQVRGLRLPSPRLILCGLG